MPIPPLDAETGYLPPGDHGATLAEIEERFGRSNVRRRELMASLRVVVEALRDKGVATIWVDGSFATAKPRPGDVDVIYVPPAGAHVESWGSLAPAAHETLKRSQRVDLWPHPSPQRDPGNPTRVITLKQLFETDLDDVPKGHLLIWEER